MKLKYKGNLWPKKNDGKGCKKYAPSKNVLFYENLDPFS